MNFTHQDLEGELVVYTVSQNKIKKCERRLRKIETNAVCDDEKMRTLIYKNRFNQTRKSYEVGLLKIKIQKKAKYMFLLDEMYP